MEESRLFKTIGRINAVLLLLVLIGTAIAFIIFVFESGTRRTEGTVTVTDGRNGDETERKEMVLGSLEEIYGHDAHYVELSTQWHGGKFSSGYSGGQTRNVLFFVGPELNAHWLYNDNANLILMVARLNRDTKGRKGKVTEAVFFRVVKKDTDGDGELSDNDLSTIALTKPDGTGYKEIEKGVRSLIDKEVSDDGRSLMLLLQSGDKIYLKKYSLLHFDKVTEKVLTGISKAP